MSHLLLGGAANMLRKFGLFCGAVSINGYIMHHAVKANERWNKYLAQLPHDELEKLHARDWYLKKHGNLYGCGNALAERADLDMYKSKPQEEKDYILIQYRWEQAQKNNLFKR